MTHITLPGYDAAQHSAVFYRVPEPGHLRIGGNDRIDFIQRQTTNDAHALTPGHAQLTVLTSATARILDVWRLQAAPDHIDVITLPGRGASTARYLQSRIFFMDKVTVTDTAANADTATAQIDVFGPEARPLLAQMGLDSAPDPDQVIAAEVDGAALHVIGHAGAIGQGYRLLVPAAALDTITGRLAAAGAHSLDAATYDLLRIEAGLPGPSGELTEDHTPLETNLDAAISGSKGCYTGQEIIARQITYDKITRRLAGLRLAAPVPVGAVVQAEGKTAGTITSVAGSPRFGSIALAVIKRPHHTPGTPLAALDADSGVVEASVVALPFV